MISKKIVIEALKAIKYGLWEIDIPSPGNCPEYIEQHKHIQEMMGVVDSWMKKLDLEKTEPEPVCGNCSWYEDGKCRCDQVYTLITDCGCNPSFNPDKEWSCLYWNRKDE